MIFILMVTVSGLLTPPDGAGTVYAVGGYLPVKDSYRVLYEIDIAEGRISPVYEHETNIFRVSRAPGSNRITVTGFDRDTVRFMSKVIDTRGQLIRNMTDTISAIFLDPAGNRMAYTKGFVNDEGREISQGVWILNVETGEERQICEDGLYLAWQDYYKTLRITMGFENEKGYIYHVESDRVESCEMFDADFSPGGRYYWQRAAIGIRIIERSSGEVISSDYEYVNTPQRHGDPPFWLDDQYLAYPPYRQELETSVLNVASGRALKIPGRLLSIDPAGTHVYVCKPGLVIEKVAMGDLEVLYDGKGERSPADAKASPGVE